MTSTCASRNVVSATSVRTGCWVSLHHGFLCTHRISSGLHQTVYSSSSTTSQSWSSPSSTLSNTSTLLATVSAPPRMGLQTDESTARSTHFPDASSTSPWSCRDVVSGASVLLPQDVRSGPRPQFSGSSKRLGGDHLEQGLWYLRLEQRGGVRHTSKKHAWRQT